MAGKNKRKGVAQALICFLGGAVMGLAVAMYAMSQSNIDQTINLQAAENGYITALHVSEEARLFMAKAMDFVIQLAIEDVSSHGGLTSKAPATGMKTTSDGVRYWRWCAASGLPAACDNSNCDPQLVPDGGFAENARKNLTAAAEGYLEDYREAFGKNETSNMVEVSLQNPDFEVNDANLSYSSGLTTAVWTRPPGVGLDASFRTAGVVNSSDTIRSIQDVRMPAAFDLAFAEASNLPSRSAGYAYDCTQSARTFTRKCPMMVPKTCIHVQTCTDADGNEFDCSYTYDCSTCGDWYWETMDAATVTDYDCLVAFAVPGSKMSDSLSPGEIKEKDHEFAFAAGYRTWSGTTCNTGSPPGTGECGDCKYESS